MQRRGHLLKLMVFRRLRADVNCSLDLAQRISPLILRISCSTKFSSEIFWDSNSRNSDTSWVTLSVVDDKQAFASAIDISFNAARKSEKPEVEVELPTLSASELYISSSAEVLDELVAVSMGSKSLKKSRAISSTCSISVACAKLDTISHESVILWHTMKQV